MASGVTNRNPAFWRQSPFMRTLQTLLFIFLLSPAVLSQNKPLHGIDTSDLDRKVDPCTDFSEFANGTWRAKNPIPASMDRWSKRWQAGETSKGQLKDILEALPAKRA